MRNNLKINKIEEMSIVAIKDFKLEIQEFYSLRACAWRG